MAGGMGNRFGGSKQTYPIDHENNFIIDYSIYDAMICGFDRVTFVIQQKDYAHFEQTIQKRISKKIQVQYAFQNLQDIPKQFRVPFGRIKPWGTGHALLACKNKKLKKFLVINADDFYGRQAFETAADFIKNSKKSDPPEYALIQYQLANTLSKNGCLKRGVCKTKDGLLLRIDESTVQMSNKKILITPLDGSKSFFATRHQGVNMNMFCFDNTIFEMLESEFEIFLQKDLKTNPLDCEFFVTKVVSDMICQKRAKVFVKNTDAVWYGMTYKKDKDDVVAAIQKMKDDSVYPQKLWDK